VTGIPEGQYLDTGLNNGRQVCSQSLPPTLTTEEPVPPAGSNSSEPTTEAAILTSLVVGTDGKCAADGLFPDPLDCRGFVKCAQVMLLL
jgi:hypothetical protein